MKEAVQSLVQAAKGQKDLLAFIAVVLTTGTLLPLGVKVEDALVFAIVLLLGWIGLRWLLLAVHRRERLQEFRNHANLESLRVLAKHGTKADIRDMIEQIAKENDKEGRDA